MYGQPRTLYNPEPERDDSSLICGVDIHGPHANTQVEVHGHPRVLRFPKKYPMKTSTKDRGYKLLGRPLRQEQIKNFGTGNKLTLSLIMTSFQCTT